VADMDGRTVLVTGSTGGIGKEVARALALLGARVVLTGRDAARAAAAADELRRATGNDSVDALTADVTRQRELRALAGSVADRYGALHGLVNNAGVNPPRRQLTDDGVEAAFAGNVLAPYLLTRLLLPVLRRGADESAAPSRVVNIAGGIPRGRIDPGNLQAEKFFAGWLTDTQYNRSKLAMMAMSRTLAERCGGPEVTISVTYPGHADTPMNRGLPIGTYPKLLRPLVPLLRPLMPVLWGDAARPARNAVRLTSAADEITPDANGVYVDIKGRPARWPTSTGDPAVRAAIWGMCERLAPR
jgi:NAD(P)-dependent dehydrogenase (short-subunit alcohol dehydrogenase family)